jgi:5-methylcytosine-specific restriction enzyme subunit McrC
MAVLAVREYERIRYGAFDPVERVVTPVQHQVLERFNEDYRRRLKITVFQHGPKQSLVAQNFVGIVNLGRDQVEILPN